nr:hypothetical protein [Tanacetum cinerariifolium]
MDIKETDKEDIDEDDEECIGDGMQRMNGGTSGKKRTPKDQESQRGSVEYSIGIYNFDDIDSGIKIGASVSNNNLHENNKKILAAEYDVPKDNIPPSINNVGPTWDTSKNRLNVEKCNIRLNVDVETITQMSTGLSKKDIDDVTGTDDSSFRIIQSTERCSKGFKIVKGKKGQVIGSSSEMEGIRMEHNSQDEITKVRFTATFGGSEAVSRSSSLVGSINSERPMALGHLLVQYLHPQHV